MLCHAWLQQLGGTRARTVCVTVGHMHMVVIMKLQVIQLQSGLRMHTQVD